MASTTFLHALLRQPGRPWILRNRDTGATLATRVVVAVDSKMRRRGLLGRTSLEDEALVIAPCNAVHTFFMKFSIDVVFVDRGGAVTRVARAVPPWRIAAALRGFAAIELASATASRTGTTAGHLLTLTAD
jgi:uncharacterized membrane protein (UPF0127 family)